MAAASRIMIRSAFSMFVVFPLVSAAVVAAWSERAAASRSSAVAGAAASVEGGDSMPGTVSQGDTIALPSVPRTGGASTVEALWGRRSIRSYTDGMPSLEHVSMLLWAAQGVTDEREGLRSAPSAGATYPLELFLATSSYLARYVPEKHCLIVKKAKDVRKALARAALDQEYVEGAPLVFIFAAEVERTEAVYGERAERYVLMEVGCASENLMLMSAALGLGSVPIGAYYDDDVGKVLDLPNQWEPYLIVPVGFAAR